MRVEVCSDAAVFRERADELLLADEARHNLALGILSTVVAHADVYPEFRGWVVLADDRPVAAALQTPPYNVALLRPGDTAALDELVAAIVDDVPGVVGAIPEVDSFARTWAAHRGASVVPRVQQRIYALDAVTSPPPTPGVARAATTDDVPLIVAWVEAFAEEALGPGESDGRAERSTRARLADPDSGFVLWEVDGAVVSLVGYGGPTPNGIRIGPVYTPPVHRRRGYGTALTAAVSQLVLDRGRTFCFLYTDLANPTSNAIYRRIGYEPVCDSRELAFV